MLLSSHAMGTRDRMFRFRPAALPPRRHEMNKDDLIRAYRENAGSWPAILGVYAILIAGMAASASAIL